MFKKNHEEPPRFIIKNEKSNDIHKKFRVIVDQNTGVNYLFIESSSGDLGADSIAVTPLYNADGSLIVDKPDEQTE